MTSSRINPNSDGIIINLTLYLNHVGLVVYLSIVQGYINPWHDPAHIIHCIIFQYVMHIPHSISHVRKICIQIVSFTSPTLYRSLSWHPPQGTCHFMFNLCWSFPLPICLKYFLDERRIESFISLIHLASLLIMLGILESWPSFILLIQIFFLPHGFFQSLRLIKLDLFFIKLWKPTQEVHNNS
jgi:hypothetical protein